MVADVSASLLTWWVATATLLVVLSYRYPDNPWGNLAFAIITAFLVALSLQALVEMSGSSPGRALTAVRLVEATSGRPLGAVRRVVRGLSKYGLIVGGVVLGLSLDEQFQSLIVLVAPLVTHAFVNALVVMLRDDCRSPLDVLVGSRSVA